MLSPLRNVIYRRLFAAQVIALLGTGLTTVGLALLAFEQSGSDAGRVLGTALAIKMIAYVSLAPIAATVAERLPRRAFLVALDVVRAGLVVCLVFVTEVWHIYVLIALLQACSAAFTPAFQATIPQILEDEAEYTKALSLSRLAYDLENLVSPMLAAAALMVMSFSGLFVFNALAFCLSAALVLSVTLAVPLRDENGDGFLRRTTFGVRAYLATPRLRGLLAFSFAAAAGGAMVIVNTVVYVRGHLALGQADTAILFAAFGGGSMLMALLLPRLVETVADRTVMMCGGALLVGGLAAGVAIPAYTLMALVWFVIGLGYAAVQTPSGRLLRRSSGEADRPAFFAAHFALSHACWLVTYPLAGWLASDLGLSTAFTVLAVLALSAIVVAAIVWPALDPVDVPHTHAPLEHTHLHVHDEHHQHDHEGWEGPEPHSHPHKHRPISHSHPYVIDRHHPVWPRC